MAYSEYQIREIKRYQEAVDEEVLEYVKAVLNGEKSVHHITVAFLSEQATEEIEHLTGKKVAGNRIVLDTNGIHHIDKRHGKNGKQDQSMSNPEDIARMGYVLMNYDEISYDGVTTTGYIDGEGNPSPMVKIKKKIDGTYYIIEAVNESKQKRNYVVTAYIAKQEKEQ